MSRSWRCGRRSPHRTRRLLDDAGLPWVRIFASGGLDEHDVARFVRAAVRIDAVGIGTRMGVSADAPALDSAYELVAFGDRPVMKLSAHKATLPGAKQVFRGRPPLLDGRSGMERRAGTDRRQGGDRRRHEPDVEYVTSGQLPPTVPRR